MVGVIWDLLPDGLGEPVRALIRSSYAIITFAWHILQNKRGLGTNFIQWIQSQMLKTECSLLGPLCFNFFSKTWNVGGSFSICSTVTADFGSLVTVFRIGLTG